MEPPVFWIPPVIVAPAPPAPKVLEILPHCTGHFSWATLASTIKVAHLFVMLPEHSILASLVFTFVFPFTVQLRFPLIVQSAFPLY